MKKHILVSIIALSLSVLALAQEGSKSIVYPTMIEKSNATALWFNSDNAAGMILTPLEKYSDMNFGYSINRGKYRLQHEGDENILKINTSGARDLGKAKVWGEFSYENFTAKDTRFNTVLLDVEPDMPFYLSDPVVSPWIKQTYDMGMKAATPVLWDLVAFGVSANYYTKAGAKQLDPRSTSYKRGISVDPSVVFVLGDKHSLGLTFSYVSTFERIEPTNSDSQHDQDAFLLRGLGNYKEAVVGSFGGINTFLYKANSFGGSLQYGFNGRKSSLLVQGKGYLKAMDDVMTPTKPQAMGSTLQAYFDANIQTIVNSDKFTHKIVLDGYSRHTDGIEYLQEMNKTYEVQQWETIAKYVRSTYNYAAVSVNYDLFRNSEQGYSWMVGTKYQWSEREDEYILPNAIFTAYNSYAELYGKKNFMAGNTSIVIGANVGYNENLDGVYKYTGPVAESVVVKEMFAKDHAILCSDYFQAGLSAKATFPIKKATAMYINASGAYLKAMESDLNRIFATFSIGFTF